MDWSSSLDLFLVGGDEHPEEVLPTLLWIAHLGGTVAPMGKTAGGWDGSLLGWFRTFFCTYRLWWISHISLLLYFAGIQGWLWNADAQNHNSFNSGASSGFFCVLNIKSTLMWIHTQYLYQILCHLQKLDVWYSNSPVNPWTFCHVLLCSPHFQDLMLQNPSELNFSLNIISLGELSTSLGLSQNWIFYPTIEFEMFGAEISHQGEALERLMTLVPCWRSSTGKIRVFVGAFFFCQNPGYFDERLLSIYLSICLSVYLSIYLPT